MKQENFCLKLLYKVKTKTKRVSVDILPQIKGFSDTITDKGLKSSLIRYLTWKIEANTLLDFTFLLRFVL